MKAEHVKLALLAGLGLLGVYLVSRAMQTASNAADAVSDAAWAVTPWNNENVLYQTASKPVQWLTSDPNATLGTAIYDVTHDGSLNPTSTNNVIYRNITPGGQSLGSWLYDKFN